ncbi:asparagine synthetase B family protein [Altererythrobacter sp. ZODW24]|uniref:asparagine synthase-related protein n=1 Tax=Altererythrobacter sp. ZODW24 TaxID=2185142 RepID=UPI000DF85D56|nr:asparagine synthetase B family protein [Altererythrobacter sp. ZODW24]
MAQSLGIFAAQPADWVQDGEAIYAQLARKKAGKPGRHWSPYRSTNGLTILFNGFIDNCAELRAVPQECPTEPAAVYAAAFEHWGEDADLHIVGDYCALIVFPDGDIRLSRSPWRAPPLHFVESGDAICAASVPRVFHACGLATKLDPAKFAANQFAVLEGMAGWYEGSHQVGLGQSVLIKNSGWQARQYYDHLAPRKTSEASRQEHLAEAERLLAEGCRKMSGGFACPGVFLSGGLDSSNVAARLMDELPDGKTLASFTFRPHPAHQTESNAQNYADDWPAVQAFAAMHPKLQPYASNDVTGFDTKLQDMFLATGIAPIGLPNMLQYHPLYAEAKKRGCDVIFDAEFGNATFSNAGSWGFSEYLLRGKWKQLAHAIARDPDRESSKFRTFLTRSIGPLLPSPVWRGLARILGRKHSAPIELISPLRDSAIRKYGLRGKVAPDLLSGRPHYASRKAMLHGLFERGEMQAGDVRQGFEQLYGIAQRDPTSYRPFVEFCLGLPTDMFLHDGQDRWLARAMAKGRMPEAQRLDRRTGLHSPDWHERLTPQLPQFRAELLAAEGDPELAELLDIPRMVELIDNWPTEPDPGHEAALKYGMAIPRAVMMVRYARFVSGRNAP